MNTDAELAAVLAELVKREPIFHRPEFGTTRADFESMTVPDFWEVGASGRCYTRAYVLDELEKRFAAPHADLWKTMDFACRRLGESTFLLTYTLEQDGSRRTRRSTIWQKTETGWNCFSPGHDCAGCYTPCVGATCEPCLIRCLALPGEVFFGQAQQRVRGKC